MGKRSRKQNGNEQGEVNTGNQRVTMPIVKLKNNTSKERIIITERKQTKKSKNKFHRNNIVSIEDSNVNTMEGNVSTINQVQMSTILAPSDNTHFEATRDKCKQNKKNKQSAVQGEVNEKKMHRKVNTDKQQFKKIKQNTMTKVDKAHSSEKTTTIDCKNNTIKTQDSVTNKANNGDESYQDILNTSNKIFKKTKPNFVHDEVQHSETKTDNKNQEKPKNKKKRKTMEEEVVDDVEIDRYCDGLDEFHNKQYEDWIKLIEENLNKKVKKYVLYFHFSSI